MSALIFSGNEYTDATRTLGKQGDGVAIPGGVAVYNGSFNNVLNGGFETNLNGWIALGAGTLISQDSSTFVFGSKSAKVVTPGTNQNEGISYSPGTGTDTIFSGFTYVASCWVTAPLGALMRVVITEKSITGVTLASTSKAFVGTGQKLHVSVSRNFNQATTDQGGIDILTDTNLQAITFNVDGAQIEFANLATPYIETNGSTASSSDGRVRGTAAWMDANQGWFAHRFLMSDLVSSWNAGHSMGVWEWADTAIKGMGLFFTLGTGWTFKRVNTQIDQVTVPGAVTSSQAITTFCTWDSKNLYLSINGSDLVPVACIRGIPAIVSTTFDMGQLTKMASSGFLTGNLFWSAGGKMKLTSANAKTLNGLPNTIAGGNDFPWKADFVWASPSLVSGATVDPPGPTVAFGKKSIYDF